MAAMSAADLDVWFKQQAGAQLRTFSKAITITHTVWVQSTSLTNYTVNINKSVTYSGTSAPDSTFNNDLDGGLGTGLVAESQDVADSVSNAVRSAVDYIEGRLTTATSASFICHNSCHASCHSSRGRR